jgi:hypothetical protein
MGIGIPCRGARGKTPMPDTTANTRADILGVASKRPWIAPVLTHESAARTLNSKTITEGEAGSSHPEIGPAS